MILGWLKEETTRLFKNAFYVPLGAIYFAQIINIPTTHQIQAI